MGGAVVRPVPPRTWATKEPAAVRGLSTVPVRVPLSILWAPPAPAIAGGVHRWAGGKPPSLSAWFGGAGLGGLALQGRQSCVQHGMRVGVPHRRDPHPVTG